ncbi:sulfite exporter TauE/SafE family protein [Parvibaculum sp.]|uniref:sulfite exporter TauE/SafE family protein n=1 Tax=Parvibaculum sp. TaxID=2024848 RepID=UPI002FD95A70
MLDPILVHALLALASGALIGLSLGLIGGGGSILAVPLLLYAVGVGSPHVAIGTGALAVAANAAMSLAMHARARTVKWPCALVFAGSGVAGAALGAQFGKAVNGDILLALFGLVMILVGAAMFLRRGEGGDPDVHLDRSSAARLLPPLASTGFMVGGLSGFFGIGGGFLIVTATAMPLLNAIGSSLVSVTVFGLTTATSYAFSGLVDWSVAGLMVLGGLGGSFAGLRLARRLSASRQMLSVVFAVIVISTGLYIVWTGMDALTAFL